MPNRNVEGDYRYGYQGEFAEKEKELGGSINSFELRLWDSSIGRWLTTDPIKAGFSPYWGMNNNPLRFYDETGGIPEDIIVRMYSRITGKLEPILVIRTTEFKETFDIKGNHFLINGITGGPDYAEVILATHLDIHPGASAIGVEFAGSITMGYGQSRSTTIAAFLKGPNQGEVYVYGDKAQNLGSDISASLSLKTYFANNEKTFDRFSLEGREIGFDISAQGVGGGLFTGLYKLFNVIYTGHSKSISPGIGPGRAYSSQSKLLPYDLNNRLPDSQKYENKNGFD